LPALVDAAMSVQEIDELRQRAPQLVQVARDQIRRDAPSLTVTTKILEGLPAHLIVEEARDCGADLIVVGSHGYGFMKRMLLGSVAHSVVANAPCSVHVVRAKRAADNGASAGGVSPTL
jgi:nucleotide-binding universal stress UspA family protein